MQEFEYTHPEQADLISSFMYKVYGWMSFALAVSASIAYYLFRTQTLALYLMKHPGVLTGVIILQFALVLGLVFFLMRMSYLTALSLFVVYAVTVGVTLSSIFFVYTHASIYATFGVTAGTFAIMSLYGYFTKIDLTRIGNFAFMALLGVILAMVINFFLRSQAFDYVISIIGVLVFVALTAYDTQKLKRLAVQLSVDEETRGKVSILGALTLYLDFLNLFLFLLRFMGNQRD